jgi:hypothetical protein
MARIITREVADSYLSSKDLKIGGWNELTDLGARVNSVRSRYCGRMSALESANFSQYVAGWLAEGDWKMLQIDNSSSFTCDQSLLLSSLLIGPTQRIDPVNDTTFLFEFDSDQVQGFQTEVTISHLVNLLLVWEAHVYLASAGGLRGERLGLQDGFVYFYGSDARLREAERLLAEFEATPNKVASWVNSLNANERN